MIPAIVLAGGLGTGRPHNFGAVMRRGDAVLDRLALGLRQAAEAADVEVDPAHRIVAVEEVPYKRVDVVIDAYGSHELYTHCADYLKPGKLFVTVGVAFAEYIVPSMLYALSW